MFDPILSSVQSLGRFSEMELSCFVSKLHVLTLPKNTCLLREGEVCQDVWFVNRGSLRQYQMTDQAEEITHDLYVEADWVLNYQSFTSQKSSMTRIQAAEACEVLQLNVDDLHALIEEAGTFFKLGQLLEYALESQEYRSNRLAPEEKYRILILSYSLAILAIPFIFVGLLPETRRIGTDNFSSQIALSIMTFGLVAVMAAAATNGLGLPLFVQHYEGASPETIGSIEPLLRYNFALNHAFDYIFMGAMCLAILFWSTDIVRTGKFPSWLGYLGLGSSVGGGAMLLSGFDFVGLHGFRLFIFGSVIWIVLAGIVLASKRKWVIK